MIDEISRIIASPIPRRQAFRLLGGVLGGGILASLGLGRASRGLAAPVTCPSGTRLCGTGCCANNLLCCGGTCYGASTSVNYNCCGTVLCRKSSQQCCTNHCCTTTQTCCGQSCCASGRACCNGTCCASGYVCCSKKCYAHGYVCCGTTACPPGQWCCGGKCYAQKPSTSTPCTRT